jgi:hypothetical protein
MGARAVQWLPRCPHTPSPQVSTSGRLASWISLLCISVSLFCTFQFSNQWGDWGEIRSPPKHKEQARAQKAEKGYYINSPKAPLMGWRCPHTPSPLRSPNGRFGPLDCSTGLRVSLFRASHVNQAMGGGGGRLSLPPHPIDAAACRGGPIMLELGRAHTRC